MSAVVVEEVGRRGQTGEGSAATRSYVAWNATSEDAALGAVYTYLVSELGSGTTLAVGARTLVLRNLEGDEELKDGWRVTATWGLFERQEPLQIGESNFNFEIAVQPVKVILPLGTQEVYKRGDDDKPTPLIRLIGDQGIPDQEPDGVEVFEPTHQESETHIFPASAITQGYKDAIKTVVGKTNNATFKGRSAGECLLTGVSGSRRGHNDWELNFRWSVKENQTGLTIAGITGINKTGWQYLWPRYELGRDENEAPILTRRIRYIVIATVFPAGNYSVLEI